VNVEDALYAAAEQTGLVGDDGKRQTWVTTRSGLGNGLVDPKGVGYRVATERNQPKSMRLPSSSCSVVPAWF
jgi:hypothetical protein